MPGAVSAWRFASASPRPRFPRPPPRLVSRHIGGRVFRVHGRSEFSRHTPPAPGMGTRVHSTCVLFSLAGNLHSTFFHIRKKAHGSAVLLDTIRNNSRIFCLGGTRLSAPPPPPPSFAFPLSRCAHRSAGSPSPRGRTFVFSAHPAGVGLSHFFRGARKKLLKTLSITGKKGKNLHQREKIRQQSLNYFQISVDKRVILWYNKV